MIRTLLASAICIAALAAPTQANIWIDKFGRSTTFEFPGAVPVTLAPHGHSIDAAASLFQSVCLSGDFSRAKAAATLDASGWGFAFVDVMMPFKQPVNIGGFRTADAAVNISDGLFFNTLPQCNLLARADQPFDAATAQAAVSQLLGAPANAAEATKKGKPNKRYQPEWVVPVAGGGSLTVYVRSSVTDPTVIHFAALQKVSK